MPRQPATPHELLKHWPADVPRPSRAAHEWLMRAHEEYHDSRLGNDRRNDPFRYRLAEELGVAEGVEKGVGVGSI